MTTKTQSKPATPRTTHDEAQARRFATVDSAQAWIRVHHLRWPDATVIPTDGGHWLVVIRSYVR
jgi:hypothetical protein